MFSRQRFALWSGRTSISLLLILLSTILAAQPTDQQETSAEVSQKVEDSSPESTTKEEKQQEAREREITEEEDPLTKRQVDRVYKPEEWAREPDELKLYGSIRVRHRWVGDEKFWADGSSRIGINGRT